MAEQPPAKYPRFEPSLRLMTGYEAYRQRELDAPLTSSARYGFFLDQARVGLDAELTRRIEAELSVELADGFDDASSDRPSYLRDAFLNLRLDKALRMKAGHFKRPFSALELTSAGKLQVRGRGLGNQLIVEDNGWGDRALGLELWGKLEPLDARWALGAFNPGWARDPTFAPEGADVLGRLSIEPLSGVTLAVNGGLKSLKYPAADDYQSYYALGGDLGVKLSGLDLLIDALYAELPLPASGLTEQTALGCVALASYDIPITRTLTLQPTLLVEYADSSVENDSSETVRSVIGLNFIVDEQLRLMPQVEVVDWLGEPSSLSPAQKHGAYLMLSLQL